MSVNIFHCADLHLDTPFTLSLAKAEKRNAELRSVFRNAIIYAKNAGTELFFIAGDLFDCQYITLETAECLLTELRSFPECRFFITPGNHDPYDAKSPYSLLDWPKNTYIFKEKRRISLEDIGVDVYGCGFTSNSMTESPVTGYPSLDPDKINILVCHGSVAAPLSKDGPILLSEIEESGFDYIALGHIHKSEGVKRIGNTSYAYSGCIEGRGFDELGYKGALAGTVSKGDVRIKGVRLSLKRFETAVVMVSAGATKPEILETIRKQTREYGSDTALRIILEGEMSDGIIISKNDLDLSAEPPYYIEIKDNTSPAVAFTDIENDTTLKGVFYRDMIDFIEKNPAQRNTALQALRYGLAALADRSVIDFDE